MKRSARAYFLKPAFHTIFSIAVNDPSDPDRCDRLWITGIEEVSVTAILIVVHSDLNDRCHYMKTRLKALGRVNGRNVTE